MSTRLSNTTGLKSLGASKQSYPDKYNPKVLESFKNKFPGQDYVVELDCPEFSALCPKTGQPDYATIMIRYCPDKCLVESKSLKMYLFSFRRTGSFHEDCINKICKDLFDLMKPKWIEVRGDFMPRGGISINPTVRRYSDGCDGSEGL